MARQTLLTKKTQELVAVHSLKSGFDILAKRADRKVKPLAGEVYKRLQDREYISNGASVEANYRFEDINKARTLSEGIAEFKVRHPKYGDKLQAVINETRETKKRYLHFGGNGIPEGVYSVALGSIGVPEHMRESMLDNILEISDMLSKKTEKGLTQMLIK